MVHVLETNKLNIIKTIKPFVFNSKFFNFYCITVLRDFTVMHIFTKNPKIPTNQIITTFTNLTSHTDNFPQIIPHKPQSPLTLAYKRGFRASHICKLKKCLLLSSSSFSIFFRVQKHFRPFCIN